MDKKNIQPKKPEFKKVEGQPGVFTFNYLKRSDDLAKKVASASQVASSEVLKEMAKTIATPVSK